MFTKVLITGGAGFLGSHTADALAARGCSVRIVDNLQQEVHGGAWPSYVQGKGFELIRADVRDRTAWERCLESVDAVFHFAAYQDQRPDFSTFFSTNTLSTALLYEAIVRLKLQVKQVVFASSQFVYGDGAWATPCGKIFYPELRSLLNLQGGRWDFRSLDGSLASPIPFREDQPVSPTNSYGLSKYAAEMAAIRLGKTYGIPTTIMRYSIIQGRRQSPRNLYSGALRIFVQQALAGEPITVYEDGAQLRDFVNVHDVVRANLAVLGSAKAEFEVFNVGGGTPVRVLDFAQQVKELTRSRSPIVIGSFRRTDSRHAVSNVDKIRRLGWEPQYTIEDSIRDYATWYQAEGFNGAAFEKKWCESKVEVSAT